MFADKKRSEHNLAAMKSGTDGIDYVTCLECGNPFMMLRTDGHLRPAHGITLDEYIAKHPGAVTTAKNVSDQMRTNISSGRKKLHQDRGYLNPQSQRDSKRVEMIARHRDARMQRNASQTCADDSK